MSDLRSGDVASNVQLGEPGPAPWLCSVSYADAMAEAEPTSAWAAQTV
jgi:hypothetical protein